MDHSEFLRQLGADPSSRDPAFLRARQSSPEFARAAAESDHFEFCLRRALNVEVPPRLIGDLKDIGLEEKKSATRWYPYALAAGVLLAAIVGGVIWRLNPGYDSVEQYVAYHYRHDGNAVLARAEGKEADNVDEVLGRFRLTLTPQVKRMVGVIKFCPTPSGKGVHMVLNTSEGPITVILMPDTPVKDGEMVDFDGMQAELLALAGGRSVAVIGTNDQRIERYRNLVRSAFIPVSKEA